MRKLKLVKCSSCGALVKVIDDCHCKCGIECCGSKMEEVKANSSDGASEKHLPTYKVKEDTIEVEVNHVMDDDHYIEWLALVTDDSEEYIYLNPGEEAKVTFTKKNGTLYSYCNKHGLWETEIK